MEVMKAAVLLGMALALVPSASAYVKYDAIVVRADIPTDYTVASIYAGAQKIPLVLLNPRSIPEPVKSELTGFRSRGYELLLIVGGEDAISSSVENELKNMGFLVNRLWDWNRYGTAARVALELWRESDSVVIANGEDYSGFLLAQHVALQQGAPILFVQNQTIPDETRDAIRKLGAKSAVLINTGDGAGQLLNSMGISVEKLETSQLKEETSGNAIEFYIAFSVIAIVLMASFIIFRMKTERKGSVFLMTEDEERMIEILRSRGRTEQNRLADLTGFSKPRVSRMLRDLEKRGLIEREKHKKTFKVKLSHKIA
ncbi:MAG: MarR family transcriptional regulator [Candidatus Aenigmarchaeota archaeon]|nr:MarR family transcriptional regulator [Candidatus Aenigmarchaeota archaeon]